MGIINKLKNIFYDEVEVPDETKLEQKETVEVKKPKIEEIRFDDIEDKKVEKKPEVSIPKTESTFSERDLFKPERTFNFTEFDEEEEVKPRINVIDLERRNKTSHNVNNSISSNSIADSSKNNGQTKVFKPSPVISPIYGILDKDYKKENVKDRSNTSFELSAEPRSYDSVRKKAYGTLEDTLSDSMVTLNTKEITATIEKIDKDVENLEKTAKLEQIISEIEKQTSNLTVGQLEEVAAEKVFEEKEVTPKTEEIKISGIDTEKTFTDNTLENDLFNLIDSMYDDKEE